MVVLIVNFTVQPGSETDCIEFCRQLSEHARQEQHCLLHVVQRANDNPRHFVILARFRTDRALETHFSTPHLLQFRERLATLVEDWDSEVFTPIAGLDENDGDPFAESFPPQLDGQQEKDMIVILVQTTVKAGSEADCIKICAEVTQATRQEPGCLHYTIQQSRADTRHFVFYEQYRDQAALEAHRAAPHFLRYREQIAPYVESRESETLTPVEEL